MRPTRQCAVACLPLLMIPGVALAQICGGAEVDTNCCRASSGQFTDSNWSCLSAPSPTDSWGIQSANPVSISINGTHSTGRLYYTDLTTTTIDLGGGSLTLLSNGVISNLMANNVGANAALIGYSTFGGGPAELFVSNTSGIRRALSTHGNVVIGTLGGRGFLRVSGNDAAPESTIEFNINDSGGAIGNGMLIVGGTPSSETAFATGSAGLVEFGDRVIIRSKGAEIGSTAVDTIGTVLLTGAGVLWNNGSGTITLGVQGAPTNPSFGQLFVGTSSTIQSGDVILNAGILAGDGVIDADVVAQDANAIIQPGPLNGAFALATGPLHLNGDVAITEGALQIDLLNSASHQIQDQIVSAAPGSTYTLGGALDVNIVSGFTPVPGDVYTPVHAIGGTVVGTFDTHMLPDLPDHRVQVRYRSDRVELLMTFKSDANGDCRVDGVDIAAVLSMWGTDDAGSDLNGDGVVNGIDLSFVLSQFGLTCD